MSVITNSINAPLPLGAPQGGLGAASLTAHGILVAEGASPAVSKVLTNGQVLIGSTGADPVAATITGAGGTTVTNGAGTITITTTAVPSLPLSTANGGTGVSSPTAHGIMIAEGSSVMTSLVLAAGQVLIGTTAGDPAAAALTAGAGISISSVSGSITISALAGGFNWNSVSGSTQTMVAENGYISNNVGGVAYTTPATAAVGDSFMVLSTLGLFTVTPGALQQILFGNTSTTIGSGALASNALGDAIEFVCVDATTPGSEVFQILNAVGNITVS